MQINPIASSGGPVRETDGGVGKRASLFGADRASLHGANNVEQALNDAPEVRPEEVERARKLIASVQYPPLELIDGISQLLARDWIGPK